MKKLLKFILVLCFIALIVMFAVFLVNRKKKELANSPKYGMRPVPVRIVTAEKGSLSVKIDYLAVVEPVRYANVSARLTAVVDKVLCDEGVKVKAGDKLLELDGREIRNDIASVVADIAQAQADLAANEATVVSLESSAAYWLLESKRDSKLADKGDIPITMSESTAVKASDYKGRLDAAKHKSLAIKHLVDSLEGKKAQLETRLSYCTITSPYSGIVTRRLVDPGDMAAPGKKLLEMEDRNLLKLSFDVPQQDLSRVHEGLPVNYTVAGKSFSVKLSHMFPTLNSARMLRAELFLTAKQSEGLSIGQYVEVSVILDVIKDVVLLPASCIVESPNLFKHVFVVEGKKLSQHKVKILGSSNDTVAVDGVKAGEKAVTNTFLGWTTLSEVKNVEVFE